MGRSAYPNLGKLGLDVLIIRGSSVRARPAPLKKFRFRWVLWV